MPVRELKTKSGQGDIVALSSRHDLGVEAGLRAVISWLTHPLSLSLDDVFRTTGLSDRFALPAPGNRTCCSDRTPDDQVRTQAAQKLYL